MKSIAYILYQLALLLLAPTALLLTLRDAKRRQGGKRFIYQRLGLGYTPQQQGALWFHAASLGEVNAIAPLVQIIQDKQPTRHIVISTGTPSGASAAAKLSGVEHAYLPIDWPWAVYNFLRCYRPSYCTIVETELWPNLYRISKAMGCAPVIINGRISNKTLKQRWLYPLFADCLQQCQHIYTRSGLDRRHFIQLGADKSRVLTVGNIKFAGQDLDPTAYPHLIKRPYLLAASTHSDEEWQFSHALAATGKLLVIIPRHPERRDEILDKLRTLPLNIAVRSQGEEVTDVTQIYLADTMGEMMAFMAHAELVFMGGSLIPHGGQNMLEAARLAKAIITGPYTHNFVDEVAALKDVGALIEVASNDALRHQINSLLENPTQLNTMGQQAQELMSNNKGIAKQYYKLLMTQWG